MNLCLICQEKATVTCAAISYCGAVCAELGWELISGTKRGRSDDEKDNDQQKKATLTPPDNQQLLTTVFHTLKKTPEMLENLANVLTIQQLRDLKYNKPLHESIWKNSNFWYYVVRRFRPDLITGPYDQTLAYKKLAMKRIIAPDMTITAPGEMNPLLREALKAVMRNPAAIDVLIRNTSLEQIQNLSRVSVDFNKIVVNSNFFWFKMWEQYAIHAVGNPYMENVNYRERLKFERPHLFDIVLQFKFEDSSNVIVKSPYDLEKGITMAEILSFGGLESFIKHLDQHIEFTNVLTGNFVSEFGNDGIIEVIYRIDDGEWYDPEVGEDISNFYGILRKSGQSFLEYMNNMQDGGYILKIEYDVSLHEPSILTINLKYPEEIQPVYYNTVIRDWVKAGFETRAGKDAIQTKAQTIRYYDNFLIQYGADLEQVDLKLPTYFTLRGDLGKSIDLEEWGALTVNGEYIPFERLEEKVRQQVMSGKNVTIELIKNF